MTRRRPGDREAVGKLARPDPRLPGPLTDKQRYKTGTARTKAKARQLKARLIQEAGIGQHRAAGTRTVTELLEHWYHWRSTVRPIADSTRAELNAELELQTAKGTTAGPGKPLGERQAHPADHVARRLRATR
jgi:hypothetical protein